MYTLTVMCMYMELHVYVYVYSTLANRQKGGERNPRNPHPMKRTNTRNDTG